MTDLAGWPAIVLTAGLATRLRPLSNVRAKAAMPVAGIPLVGRILAWLRQSGIRDVVLNLHHLPHTITRVVGDGSQWDVAVRYSWEPTILGSAGGPRRAMRLLDVERCLIVNGDTWTDCDLHALVQRHTDARADVTMAVVPGDVHRYGGVVMSTDGSVLGFARASEVREPVGASQSTVRHFIGVQAVETRTFADVRDDQASETVRTLYPRLIGERPGSVIAFDSRATFLDIGTARDYLATVAALSSREGRPFDRGAAITVAPGAVLQNTVLWDRVHVGQGAQLINCVVADDVSVAADARHENSILVRIDDELRVTPL
jgi:mannose-1-phosphate guanylyltransferase